MMIHFSVTWSPHSKRNEASDSGSLLAELRCEYGLGYATIPEDALPIRRK